MNGPAMVDQASLDKVEEKDRAGILVLGLGNTLLCDDGIGIYLGQAVCDLLRGLGRQVDFLEAALAGLQLLDHIAGYRHLVVIDAVRTDNGRPGSLYYLSEESLQSTVRLTSVHDINLATALQLGRNLGMSMPERIDIYAVEAEDLWTFQETCTATLTMAIPSLAAQIAQAINGNMVTIQEPGVSTEYSVRNVNF